MSQHKVTQNEILESAKEIFFKFGYQKTTMNDIAKKTHKAKSTLYHYFNSKSEIFTAIVEIEIDKIENNCVRKANQSDDLIEKIRLFTFSLFHKDQSKVFDEFGYAILFDFFYFAPLIKDIVIEHQKFNIDFLENIISKGVEKGLFFTNEPGKTAKAIIMSITSMSQKYPDGFIDQDLATAEHLFDIFIKGLTTQ